MSSRRIQKYFETYCQDDYVQKNLLMKKLVFWKSQGYYTAMSGQGKRQPAKSFFAKKSSFF